MKYNALSFLLHIWNTLPHHYNNEKKFQYISRRLLDLGYCTECDNAKYVERISCTLPMNNCCGGCIIHVDCENCK
jgi:hypothetical protein